MHNENLTSSVIIPFYNGKEFVFETIDSIKKQTRQPDEIIIVNDGSTHQESIEILKNIEQKYKEIEIIHQENKGIAGAMTTGAKYATGDIIFQMDCDDILHEKYIEKYMKVFELDNSVDGVTSQYASFFDGLDYTKEENIHHIYKPEGLIIPDLFFRNCAGGANSAYRKSALEKVGYWDERFRSYQDWGLWLKFVEYDLKQHIIEEVLYYYRIHKNSDLRTIVKKFDLYGEIRVSVEEIFTRKPDKYNLVNIIQKIHKLTKERLDIYSKQLEQKNTELNQKEQTIQQKNQQVKTMQSSKFWKMRNVYIHYKNGIKQGIKNPKLFFVFLKKRIHKVCNMKKDINNVDVKKIIGVRAKKHHINTVDEIIYNKFINIQDIEYMNIDSDSFRLNIVTDSISKGSLFGGVATALILATLFSNKYNISLRIIVRGTDIIPADFVNFLNMFKIEIPKNVEFFTDYERNNKSFNKKLEVSKNDIFLATSWWSARVIEKINRRKTFFYILQEVEEMFYDNGDEKLMCNQILNKSNINYLINTKLLFDFYEQNGYDKICQNALVFEPAFPKNIYTNDEDYIKEKSQKKRLFFYARPNNHRNLFYSGIQFLDLAITKSIIDTDEWEIYLVGSDNIQPIKFSDGSSPIMLGVMDWVTYLQFIKTIDLGFCLMYTPHPSYPPLDIVACGGVVLTNKYENKIELGYKYSKNIILSELNNKDMMGGFRKAVKLSVNKKKRAENFRSNNLNTDWMSALEDVVVFMNKNK